MSLQSRIIYEVRFKLINQVSHCIQNWTYTCSLSVWNKLTGRAQSVQELGAEGNIWTWVKKTA